MSKSKIAISVGDLNGIGIEIALKAHEEISKYCKPIYCINSYMLEQATKLLNIKIPQNFQLALVDGDFKINAGVVSEKSGSYSFDSFMKAVKLCKNKECQALVTLPIHKEAWMMAGLEYKGHTDALRKYFKQEAIMMLGCEDMFVALFTEHIPLKDVASTVTKENLFKFFLNLHKELPNEKFAVLGLNPHAGDNGVLGKEEDEIKIAIKLINKQLNREVFIGPIVPDVAFTPNFRKNFTHFVAMYHDQGLTPLKALYFDESINVSLNLPIVRTSVDHGTAFDIAYKNKANLLSYLNAVKYAINFKCIL